MMITDVSQNEKKACTRWMPDAFADKINGNTWHIAITQEGLRKTTSKNTVVSYHWIQSRSRMELVWGMRNKKKLNGRKTVSSGGWKRSMDKFLGMVTIGTIFSSRR